VALDIGAVDPDISSRAWSVDKDLGDGPSFVDP
jgi:hypothetical protein